MSSSQVDNIYPSHTGLVFRKVSPTPPPLLPFSYSPTGDFRFLISPVLVVSMPPKLHLCLLDRENIQKTLSGFSTTNSHFQQYQRTCAKKVASCLLLQYSQKFLDSVQLSKLQIFILLNFKQSDSSIKFFPVVPLFFNIT